MGAEQIIQSSAAPQNYAAFSDILQIEVIVPAMILLVATVLIQQVILKPDFTKVLYYEILEVVESRDKLVAKAKLILALLVNVAEVCFPALSFVRNWWTTWGFGASKCCGEKKETKNQEKKSDICQDVANWAQVSGRLAGVFAAELELEDDDEQEVRQGSFLEEKSLEEKEREPVDVASWAQVSCRLAGVFAAEKEPVDVASWAQVGGRLAGVFAADLEADRLD